MGHMVYTKENDRMWFASWRAPFDLQTIARLQVGDRFTLPGCYVRRTFWQWLTRTPRRLQIWTIRETGL